MMLHMGCSALLAITLLYISVTYTSTSKMISTSSKRPRNPNTDSGIMSKGETKYKAAAQKHKIILSLRTQTSPPTENSSVNS